MFKLFFQISDLFLDPFIIFFSGIFGGFISGFLGIGCGVIITPILMEFGIPPLIAIATQLCHAVGTNLSNFLSYKRNSDVDFHLAFYILLGGFLGAACEFLFLQSSSNNSGAVLNKFIYIYISVLIIFGIIMFTQSLKEIKKKKSKKYGYNVMMRRWMLYLPFHRIFIRSRAEMSILIPIFVGFLAGLLVASLGGGTNLFMAPIITYLIGRISPVVSGTTALAGCVITAIVAFIYSYSGYCCDIFVVLILFAGAAFGSFIGVKLTYNTQRYRINIIASFVIFAMAFRQIFRLLNNPFVNSGSASSDLTKSSIPSILNYNMLIYTIVCIIIIAVIAYITECLLQLLSKKHKDI